MPQDTCICSSRKKVLVAFRGPLNHVHEVLVENLLLAVGQFHESVVDVLPVFFGHHDPQLLQAAEQSPAARVPSQANGFRVLAHILGTHDSYVSRLCNTPCWCMPAS